MPHQKTVLKTLSGQFERKTLPRIAEAGALFLGLFVVAVRPTFSGLASPLELNVKMHLAIFMALCLVTLILALRKQLALRAPLVTLALLAFAAMTVLTAFLADYRFAAMVRMLDLVAWCALILVLVQVISTPLRARLSTAALTATLALLAVYGLHQYFFGLDEIQRELPRYIQDLVASGKLSSSLSSTFVKRATSGDVFGTFMIANGLAGYLIILLPAAFAAALVLWREHKATGVVVGLVAIAALVVLGMTRSKGGMLSLAAVVVAAGVWFVFRRIRGVMAVAALLLMIAVTYFAQTSTDEAALARRNRFSLGDSAEVRVEYWKGTLGIIKKRPWLGVGPGNFKDHYLAHRTPEGSETDYAHNDTLEVAAEMGLVGLLIYLAIWVTWFAELRRSPPKPDVPEQDDGKARLILVVLIGAAGVLAIVFTMSRFVQTTETGMMMLIGLVVWLGVYAVQARQALGVEAPMRHAGLLKGALVVGVCAFLVHSTIDFDLNVPGITAPLACVLATALALRRTDAERKPRRLGTARQLSLTIGVATPLLLAVVFLLYPLMETSLSMQQARGAMAERATLLREANHARKMGNNPLAEMKLRQADRLLSGDVRQFLRTAAACYPENPEPVMELADLEAASLHGRPDADRKRFVVLLDTVKRLRPHDPKPYARFTQVLMSQVNAADEAKQPERAKQLAAEALVEITEAVRRYPTSPQLVLMRAETLERLGRNREAVDEYEKALDYAERTSEKELKFPPDEVRRITRRVLALKYEF